jgi:hypothetical protein
VEQLELDAAVGLGLDLLGPRHDGHGRDRPLLGQELVQAQRDGLRLGGARQDSSGQGRHGQHETTAELLQGHMQ